MGIVITLYTDHVYVVSAMITSTNKKLPPQELSGGQGSPTHIGAEGTAYTNTVTGLLQALYDLDRLFGPFKLLVELVIHGLIGRLVLAGLLYGQVDPADRVVELIGNPVDHQGQEGVHHGPIEQQGSPLRVGLNELVTARERGTRRRS